MKDNLVNELGDLVNDCISRQAAIEALDKRFDSIPMNQTTEILLLRKDLRELPSAQPEQPWIPCSERLPEDEQPILFSTTTGRVHQGRFHRDNSVNRWYSSLDKMRAYNNVVNAWMPLPEPYREEEQDG